MGSAAFQTYNSLLSCRARLSWYINPARHVQILGSKLAPRHSNKCFVPHISHANNLGLILDPLQYQQLSIVSNVLAALVSNGKVCVSNLPDLSLLYKLAPLSTRAVQSPISQLHRSSFCSSVSMALGALIYVRVWDEWMEIVVAMKCDCQEYV